MSKLTSDRASAFILFVSSDSFLLQCETVKKCETVKSSHLVEIKLNFFSKIRVGEI